MADFSFGFTEGSFLLLKGQKHLGSVEGDLISNKQQKSKRIFPGGERNLYPSQTLVCHFDRKSSTQKFGNLPKIETQKSGSLPRIETQKSGNPKRQAFRLHEKTYHPDQKVLDIKSTFQFHLFYQRILLFNFCFMMICAESFKFSSTTISLSCAICSVLQN